MSFVSDFFKDISGRTARDASRQAGRVQSEAARDAAGNIVTAGQQATGIFDPFQQVGRQGLDQAGFLGDPQAQFDFLQSNPLFQLALDNANRTTQASAASRGRLSAGDTLQQLSNNVLLSASPLIDRQRQDIMNQLNFGQGIAGQQANILQNTAANQGNLLTGAAAAEAGGIVGAANAMGQGANSLLGLGGSILGAVGNPFASAGSSVNPLATGANAGTGVLNTNLGGDLFGTGSLFGSPP